MSKYLVECSCGNKLPVEIGQAGGQVTCTCGNLVDVPPLRKLRHLQPETTTVERPTSTWSARKGVITASLILAGALTIANAWSWLTQPKVPVFDPVAYQRDVVERRLTTITPTQSWLMWVEYYRPMAERGFSYLELANRGEIERIIAERHSLRRTLWIVAGIAVATAVAAALWPKAPDIERQLGHCNSRPSQNEVAARFTTVWLGHKRRQISSQLARRPRA
jgi:hypothetical protein